MGPGMGPMPPRPYIGGPGVPGPVGPAAIPPMPGIPPGPQKPLFPSAVAVGCFFFNSLVTLDLQKWKEWERIPD